MGIDWVYWLLVKVGEPPIGVQLAGERLGELSNTNPDGSAGQEICSVPPPRFATPSAGRLTTSMGYERPRWPKPSLAWKTRFEPVWATVSVPVQTP